MNLHDLLAWIQRGNGIREIPKTDVDKCPTGMIINITDMDEKQVTKLALTLLPVYADVPVVNIGIPKPPAPKKVVTKTVDKKESKQVKKNVCIGYQAGNVITTGSGMKHSHSPKTTEKKAVTKASKKTAVKKKK